ncbi:ECF transporter S component [Bacillota bacterium LX-D]|nr:ECF transporter S component [Bacillota bacterium LX-D]
MFIFLILFPLTVGILPNLFPFELNWAVLSTIIVLAALGMFFSDFEKRQTNVRKLTLLTTLAALGAAGKVPFAALMSFQPTMFIAMITGYVFGPKAGFLVGALAVFTANFFIGQGLWTPWQMFAMGLAGASASFLTGKQKQFRHKIFSAFCFGWGFFYGWIMNFWHWVGFVYPLSINSFLATYLASFSFETVRALGNLLFSLLLGRSFYEILVRFRKKVVQQPLV